MNSNDQQPTGLPPRDQERVEAMKRALSPDRVLFLEATTKTQALEAVITVLAKSPLIGDKDELTQAVFTREGLMSTGIGLGLAVPHVRLASVRDLVMAVGISRPGIADYAALDDKPVHLLFLIAAPEGQHADYLRLLAAISSRAKLLNGRLLDCEDAEDFCNVLMNTATGN